MARRVNVNLSTILGVGKKYQGSGEVKPRRGRERKIIKARAWTGMSCRLSWILIINICAACPG